MSTIQVTEPFQGPKPPPGAPVGHIWFNDTNDWFYVKISDTQWAAYDIDETVIDIIKEDSHEDAYDRAMSIL